MDKTWSTRVGYLLSTSTSTVPRNPERRLQSPHWSKWYPCTSKLQLEVEMIPSQQKQHSPYVPFTCLIQSFPAFPKSMVHHRKMHAFRYVFSKLVPAPARNPTLKKLQEGKPRFRFLPLKDSSNFCCWSLAWSLEKLPRLFATAKLWCKHCSRYSSSPPWPDFNPGIWISLEMFWWIQCKVWPNVIKCPKFRKKKR